MSKESIDTINEKSPDVFEMIAVTMIEFREEMESFDRIRTRIAARTRFIMRVVFTTLTLSSIYTGVYDLSDGYEYEFYDHTSGGYVRQLWHHVTGYGRDCSNGRLDGQQYHRDFRDC